MALFAIGDLHGDLERARAALRLCGLANTTAWTGRQATLVQTGDLVDRGASSLNVMKLFHVSAVEFEPVAGSQVYQAARP